MSGQVSTMVPHVEDEPLQFAIRKGVGQIWIKRHKTNQGSQKPSIKDYAYSCLPETATDKALKAAEKNGRLIIDPEKQGYELVEVEWKPFRQKMPLRFYCGIVENHSQQITYLFEHTETGATYEMHWSHFENMLRQCTVVAGVFYEEWTMTRKRNRYTIVPLWINLENT